MFPCILLFSALSMLSLEWKIGHEIVREDPRVS